jgi:hypothetical protein
MSAGMVLHICLPEQRYNLALDEFTLNSMSVDSIQWWSTYADTAQIKTVFLITIGIFELG